jgi:hypothetical protein
MQVFHMRQRWGDAVWRAQTQVLLVGARLNEVYCLQPACRLSTRPTSPPYPAPQLLSPPSPPPSPDPLACDLQLASAAVSAARRDSASSHPSRAYRLGERRRLRAWPGPASGRSVGGGGFAAWPLVKAPPKKKTQPRQGRGLTATLMRTTALLSTAWAARRIRAGREAPSGWRWRLCARPCCV